MLCNTPAQEEGGPDTVAVQLIVNGDFDSLTPKSTDEFKYSVAIPLYSISPAFGSWRGHTRVEITGDGFFNPFSSHNVNEGRGYASPVCLGCCRSEMLAYMIG